MKDLTPEKIITTNYTPKRPFEEIKMKDSRAENTTSYTPKRPFSPLN
jgi:hypothetical protein